MNKISSRPPTRRRLLSLACAAALAAALAPFAATPAAHAQQPPADDGFARLRLANATGLDGRLQIFIKGENINPEGYESGAVTGSFGMYPGPLEIEVKHPLIDDTKHTVQLNPTDRMAIVIYTEPKKDESGVVTKRVVKFTTLQRKPGGKKRTATLLFLSVSQGIELGMNESKVDLKPHKQVDIGFGDARNSQINLTVQAKPLKTFDIDEPGDYAVIVYDRPDGTQGCITFNNTKR